MPRPMAASGPELDPVRASWWAGADGATAGVLGTTSGATTWRRRNCFTTPPVDSMAPNCASRTFERVEVPSHDAVAR